MKPTNDLVETTLATKTKKSSTGSTKRGEKIDESIDKMTRKEQLRRAIMDTCDAAGNTTPERVFEAARNPNNPLHSEFIWDGQEAVRALGLETAARLIRTLKVEVVVRAHKIIAPFYVSDPRENDVRNYVPLTEVKQSADISRAVMLDELSRIESAINRARAISGFLEMAEEFESMLANVFAIRARIGAKN